MLLGAVDLGSNSFRVEINRLCEGRLIPEQYWKETVRLAGGLDSQGAISADAQHKALAALARFREKLSGLDPRNIRAVATQTFRSATNAAQFLPLAEQALGHRIEVISGLEEARLVFSGCMHTLPPSDERRLVVDVGGASTELIIGSRFEPRQCESFHVGCVNTSVDCFAQGKITASAFAEAQMAAQAEFDEARQDFAPQQWDRAFGSAGTFGAVSDIGYSAGLTSGSVTPALLERLKSELIEIGDINRIEFPGLKQDRREVIAGGVAVLLAAFKTFGIEEMFPASGALRVGLLYDLMGRNTQSDTRELTVSTILSRSGVDTDQGDRVCSLADRFFDALCEGQPDREQQNLLQWTARLHEIGRTISPSGYHHHSHYILLNSDLPGFSRSDQARMACLALGQRGHLKKVAAALADPVQTKMLCALRLAVIFAHARRTVLVPNWDLHYADSGLVFSVDALWLKQYPLTNYLLEQERLIWARVNIPFELKLLD